MNNQYCVIYCTYPDRQTAEEAANGMLEARLVACTNIIPNISAHYIWENNTKEGKEELLMMKTRQDKLPEVEKFIVDSHPYEFPEFIAMPIIYGNKNYLSWIDEVVG